MKAKRTYQVKDVARISGVSIRTLHHYDEIRLLVPKARSGGGYRLYNDDDLLRLQHILIGRELAGRGRRLDFEIADGERETGWFATNSLTFGS